MKIENIKHIRCTNNDCLHTPEFLEIDYTPPTKVKCGDCDYILVEIPESEKNETLNIMNFALKTVKGIERKNYKQR